jgi:predicted kinase
MAKIAFIFRGLPGSGKSMVADYICLLAGRADIPVKVFSLDSYRIDENGEYVYDPSKNKEISDKMYSDIQRSVELFKDDSEVLFIVDNTHSRVWEFERSMQIFTDAGFLIHVLEVQRPAALCAAENKHFVPGETIERMQHNWEDVSGKKHPHP